jgi:quercetin dioxygenase-like cupin family protein
MRISGIFSLAALLVCSAAVLAQAPAMITMDQEPHHHLSLKNDYVKVFRVEVAPGDSILMHSHDRDTVAIAIGDQMVTVGFPDKPGVHQKNPDGQLRLQKSGYIHSTAVDPGTAYHTVAVELLQTQTNPHNVCAAVMAGEPLHCVDIPANDPPVKYSQVEQFQSDQTLVQLVGVPAGEKMTLGDSSNFHLLVALDPGTISAETGSGAAQPLHAGDFVWIARGRAQRTISNTGQKEQRMITFRFTPIDPNGKRP